MTDTSALPPLDSPLGVGIAVALGCGLLIGVERERRKNTAGHRATAGVRTFTIAALAGALAQGLGQTWLLALGGLLVVALMCIGYWRERSKDPGITTELALFVTYVLGVTAVDYPRVAGATAVIVAILLVARNRLHQFSTEVLTSRELHSALVLAGSALVVMPLIPDRPLPYLAQVNPRDLWRLTVLLMSLQAAGHVGLRMAGARLGLALTGVVSGFISSTATIAAMGARAREEPALRSACITGALASNLSTVALMFVVATTVEARLLPAIALPMLACAAVVGLTAILSLRRQQEVPSAVNPQSRVFSFAQTIGFAAMLSGVTTVVALLSEHAPQGAQYLGVAMAGFADVHAASAAAFNLVASHKIQPDEAVVPMLLALTTNSISKVIGAWVSGGARFGALIGLVMAAMVAAGWSAWWLSL